jgi:hypothetical protein
MPLTDVELSSAALTKLGASGISSFMDNTTEAQIASSLYPITRDAMLALHPWSFATTYLELTEVTPAPLAEFEHAYDLPVDFIRALSAGEHDRGKGQRYQIIGQQLHSNSTTVTLTYLRRPDELEFPAYFVSALVGRLAAEFCLPLTENSTRSELLFRLAGAELRLAKLLDSQQDTPPAIEDFTLVEARFS